MILQSCIYPGLYSVPIVVRNSHTCSDELEAMGINTRYCTHPLRTTPQWQADAALTSNLTSRLDTRSYPGPSCFHPCLQVRRTFRSPAMPLSVIRHGAGWWVRGVPRDGPGLPRRYLVAGTVLDHCRCSTPYLPLQVGCSTAGRAAASWNMAVPSAVL